ncbi:MAG: hypothetical protein LBQ66_12710 [Planctomycetaceae bacterium]|nr:hypothetical protein [Planctomycetaceae bacterium]
MPRSGEGLERGRPARLCALGNQISLEGTPRRVGEHLLNRFGVQFKLFWFYYAQRRAGRPRSSPSPLRGELMWYNETSTPTLFTKKARQSVAHLTLTTRRSVAHLTLLTCCLVLYL